MIPGFDIQLLLLKSENCTVDKLLKKYIVVKIEIINETTCK